MNLIISRYKEFAARHLNRAQVKRLLWYALYLVLVLLAQNMIFTEVRIFGVCAMFIPAAAVAVGMFEGAVFGSVFGLILGFFADMAFVENTLMFTILMPALAFGAGFVAQFFINRRFFAYMGVAFAGLLITAVVQMLRVAAADGISGVMLTTVILQTLWSLPAAVLIYFPPAKWIQ